MRLPQRAPKVHTLEDMMEAQELLNEYIAVGAA